MYRENRFVGNEFHQDDWNEKISVNKSGRAGARNRRSRRKQALLQKGAFTCMTALFVMIFALSVFSLSAKADSTEHANEYKYYTSHRIEQGESLWSIASTSMDDEHYDSVQDYIDEIKTVNQISGDQIQSGNYLLLPYFSEDIK